MRGIGEPGNGAGVTVPCGPWTGTSSMVTATLSSISVRGIWYQVALSPYWERIGSSSMRRCVSIA